jgi:hypothetical protein
MGFARQNGDSSSGWITVLFFLWAKGLGAKDVYKEMFLVYGGKCSLRKAVPK